ncbi:hypothetical protein MKW98_019344 [Papaver atlanticum]|uniref:Uncharacterized protein n=1 Tax=Papaver atlanticum TaxID=357466 RepID=A0AAD4SAQ4_9MAGN|nr:hypothetical protein MKW98_019344 [Papaver atlanticum]
MEGRNMTYYYWRAVIKGICPLLNVVDKLCHLKVMDEGIIVRDCRRRSIFRSQWQSPQEGHSTTSTGFMKVGPQAGSADTTA